MATRLHYNGIQCVHEGVVIKIKGNGTVCIDKIVKGFESVIVVGIEKICVNTDFHIDRVLGCQMGVGIGSLSMAKRQTSSVHKTSRVSS